MLKNEIKKCISLRTLVVFAVLCLLSFFPEIVTNKNEKGFSTAYENAVSEYSEIPKNERLQCLESELTELKKMESAFGVVLNDDPLIIADCENNCRKIWGDNYREILASMDLSEEAYLKKSIRKKALKEIQKQIEYLSSYDEYLDTIHSNASRLARMPIYNNNAYSRRNNVKTDKDYPQSGEIIPELTTIKSLESYFSGNIDIICAIALVIYLTVCFTEDKKNGLRYLLYGCSGGRRKLAQTRIIVLSLLSTVGTALISGLRLISCIIVNGRLPEVGAVIQSSELFKGCVYNISFLQIVFFRFLFSVIAAFLCGCFCYLIFECCRNYKFSLFICVFCFAFQFLVYSDNKPDNIVVFLETFNICAVAKAADSIIQYQNINVFGYPVQGWGVSLTFAFVSSAIIILGLLLVSEKNRPIHSSDVFTAIGSYYDKCFSRIYSKLPVLLTEIRKNLVFQRGIIVFAAFVLIFAFYFDVAPSDSDMFDQEKNTASLSFIGPINSDTFEKIEQRREEIKSWADKESGYSALEELSEISDSVTSKSESGNGLWVVNEAAYSTLYTGDTSYQMKVGLLAISAMVFLCSGLFSYEEQCLMKPLLYSTAAGRKKTARRKILLTVFYALIICAFVAVPEIMRTEKFYGNLLSTFSAPVQSMSYLSNFEVNIPFWLFTILYYFAKFLCLCVAGLSACIVSCKTKNINISILVSFVILLLPGVLCYFGLHSLSYISLNSLWSPFSVPGWLYAGCILICITEFIGINSCGNCKKN